MQLLPLPLSLFPLKIIFKDYTALGISRLLRTFRSTFAETENFDMSNMFALNIRKDKANNCILVLFLGIYIAGPVYSEMAPRLQAVLAFRTHCLTHDTVRPMIMNHTLTSSISLAAGKWALFGKIKKVADLYRVLGLQSEFYKILRKQMKKISS